MNPSSPKLKRSNGLRGFVAVNVSRESTRATFETSLRKLRALGWTAGASGDDIALVSSERFEAANAIQATIVLCETTGEASRLEAVEPAPFTILDTLGGTQLERALAESVIEDHTVDRMVVGLNWTLVRAGDLCGIARSPARGTEGARGIRPETGFRGRPLRGLASHLCSVDPLARSLGLAAVNAYWNRVDPPDACKDRLHPTGGLRAIEPPGQGLVIVGGFRAAQKRLPEARVVEREPKPGDLSVKDAPKAYREASQLAITAQALMNGSLEPILQASCMVPRRLLVGPSAPVCPVVIDHGFDEVFGAVVTDPDAAEDFIVETGTMIILDHIAKNRCLR